MTDRKSIAEELFRKIADHNGDLNAAFPNPFRFHKHQRGRRQAFNDWGLAYFVIPNEKTFIDYVEGRLNITTRRSANHATPYPYRDVPLAVECEEQPDNDDKAHADCPESKNKSRQCSVE